MELHSCSVRIATNATRARAQATRAHERVGLLRAVALRTRLGAGLRQVRRPVRRGLQMPRKRCLTYEGLAPGIGAMGARGLATHRMGAGQMPGRRRCTRAAPMHRAAQRPGVLPAELQPQSKPPVKLKQPIARECEWLPAVDEECDGRRRGGPACAASEQVSRSLRQALKFEDFEGFRSSMG